MEGAKGTPESMGRSPGQGRLLRGENTLGKCQFVGRKLGTRLDWKKEKVRSGEWGESKKAQEPPEGSIKSQNQFSFLKGGCLGEDGWQVRSRCGRVDHCS